MAVNPPTIRKQPRRPKKMRRRGLDETIKHPVSTRKGVPVHCKRCFQPNHNSRTCKNEIHPASKFYKPPQANSDKNVNISSSAEASTTEQTTMSSGMASSTHGREPKDHSYLQPTVASTTKVVHKSVLQSQRRGAKRVRQAVVEKARQTRSKASTG